MSWCFAQVLIRSGRCSSKVWMVCACTGSTWQWLLWIWAVRTRNVFQMNSKLLFFHTFLLHLQPEQWALQTLIKGPMTIRTTSLGSCWHQSCSHFTTQGQASSCRILHHLTIAPEEAYDSPSKTRGNPLGYSLLIFLGSHCFLTWQRNSWRAWDVASGSSSKLASATSWRIWPISFWEMILLLWYFRNLNKGNERH